MYQLIPLNPPLLVSGEQYVAEEDGEVRITFTDALAVAIYEDGDGAAYLSYRVVLPNGHVYEVQNRNITAARPYGTPPNAAPVYEETEPREYPRLKFSLSPQH